MKMQFFLQYRKKGFRVGRNSRDDITRARRGHGLEFDEAAEDSPFYDRKFEISFLSLIEEVLLNVVFFYSHFKKLLFAFDLRIVFF